MAGVSELQPGVVVGRDYRVVAPLRSGGMGAVYVVEQLSTGSRRALKIMHPSIASDAPSRERFRQEARAGSRIESEHVVQVLAAGFDDQQGMPWLVMELLEGKDLAEELDEKGRLSPLEVLMIFEQLCHAVGAAHRASIVHRDLKPENIFLARAKSAHGGVSVKVLDFGIAKIVAEAQSSNTGAIGTPLYMAPEQTVAGESITPATDVWALGLIAFKLLTGTNFWKTARSEEPSSLMMLREVAIDPIPPARERARELGVEEYLPARFDRFFERCLTRTAQARFENAEEFFAGLRDALGGEVSPTVLSVEDEDELEQVVPSGKNTSARAMWVAAGALVLAAGLLLVFSGGKAEGPSSDDGASLAAPQKCPRDTAAVAGGTFRMGDVTRTVKVAGMCFDLDEVTRAEYETCVKSGACSAVSADCNSTLADSEANPMRLPVGCVTFEQAEAFCAAREMRLPSEEEWEWVARRGATASAYPWGNDEPGGQLCWSGQLEKKASCPVGSYSAGDTAEHVRDLAGNVSEWTSSRDGAKRVIRGSSWADDDARRVRSAYRSFVGATHRHQQLGFRCVRGIAQLLEP